MSVNFPVEIYMKQCAVRKPNEFCLLCLLLMSAEHYKSLSHLHLIKAKNFRLIYCSG